MAANPTTAPVHALPAAAQDAPAPTDAATAHAGAQPETCSVCHKEAGDKHQASYDELYQDGVIQVTDLAYAFAGPDTTTVTFKMTKDGVPFDARESDSLAIHFAPYGDGQFQFEPAAERMSLKGALAYDGSGRTTSTMTGTVDLSAANGLIRASRLERPKAAVGK